jgi:uncharacterized membrane protein YtjA (UPF0391 family)
MLGWTILFGLMTLPGAAATMSGYPAAASVKTAAVVFAILFVMSLLTQFARSRAR